jgi:hypothetical protein
MYVPRATVVRMYVYCLYINAPSLRSDMQSTLSFRPSLPARLNERMRTCIAVLTVAYHRGAYACAMSLPQLIAIFRTSCRY